MGSSVLGGTVEQLTFQMFLSKLTPTSLLLSMPFSLLIFRPSLLLFSQPGDKNKMVVESSEEGWEKSSKEGLKISSERGVKRSGEVGVSFERKVCLKSQLFHDTLYGKERQRALVLLA